jgi:DNA-directed RNA polymerase specialized sigma24 family protein
MKQREALNNLTLDLIKLNKKKNRRLTAVLMVSLALNIVLACMVLDMRTEPVEYADETIIVSAVMTKKPSEHIATRQKLKNIYEVKTFEELLERCILTEDEKYILRQHYLHGKSFVAISMDMGYSEDTIKHKHQKILKKIQRLL